MTTQVPTVIASDPEQSNADAYTAAGEGTGAPGITRSRIPDASTFDLGDSGDVGRTAEETPGRSYRRTNKPDCQAVVYTYCPVARREFHYRASVNACWPPRLTPWCSCVLAGSTGSPRAANCEHSCVFGYRPKDACFDTPLFSGCDRQDVSETAWYFEGGRCHLWGFPAGACPSNDSAVFSTAAEVRQPLRGRLAPRVPPVRRPAADGLRPEPAAVPVLRSLLGGRGSDAVSAHFGRPGRRPQVLGRRQPVRLARRLRRGLREDDDAVAPAGSSDALLRGRARPRPLAQADWTGKKTYSKQTVSRTERFGCPVPRETSDFSLYFFRNLLSRQNDTDIEDTRDSTQR
ncbi:uncharacterized protein LOC119432554 [Dermacentor silvarum]|uniref:uncharacterized protein LOC119432554 n=1 Tax=Dermacentor silvarum TaxID=543639 RepID=UPI0021015412|nr:uncharacterized protein LOC119432554 [Dermacentor silvarum]